MSLHLFQLPTMATKKTTKLLALLSLSLALSFGSIACAADVDPNIIKLEKRFFEHDYPKDTTEARIERLEKMVFGEAKTGSVQERLNALMAVVPSVDSHRETTKTTPSTSQPSNYDATRTANDVPSADVKEFEDTPGPAGNYPAISAIESKLLGREYSDEPARKRLDRLETKVFGKPSGIDDMTERMDRLKMKTGVDVAKQAPTGSDWADDDDFSFDSAHPPRRTAPPLTYTAPPDADATSFSGRNLRQDMQRNFGMPSSSMGTYPQSAPDYRRSAAAPAPEALGGLNQQVTHLETLIFGKSYSKDSLPARVNRLELTLYPQQPLAVTTPLPDRVKRMLGTVPGAVPNSTASRNYDSQPSYAPQRNQPTLAEDLDDMDTSMGGNFPQPAPQYQKRSSGLSKIINSIGAMMGSGYGGGYTTQSGTLVTDPQTGLLYDQATGVLIDPLTGAVVGQRYPANPSPSYGGFNNGFSPYGGGMGTGMRFGFGGMGGMWP